MRMFGQRDVSAFDTLDHDKHRQRREPWNPYFSKQSVSRLQPLLIQAVVNKLCMRLAEYQAAGKPINMGHAFSCVTTDVISEYSFPQGYNLLDKPEFDFAHYDEMALSKFSHVLKQFGWLYPLLDSMPIWVTKHTNKDMYLVLHTQDFLYQQTLALAEQRGNAEYKETTSRPSMMQAFMDSPSLPESEKSPERIKGEAQIAIGAGTLTTTHALKAATYHILANPEVKAQLMEELERCIPDLDSPPNLRQLEQMPYLMVVMYESLRIFYGNSHRLLRIFPDRVLQYKDVVIPPGTPVSMSTIHVHANERIFPNPYNFDVTRWQGANPPLKYLVPWGKGSRSCVGMDLAKADFLTTLANKFRRFGRQMELYDVVRDRDIDTVHDVFNPLPSRESTGLRVLIKPRD